MDEMKEIIDARTAEYIIRAIAIGGPVAGLVIGSVVGMVRKRLVRKMLEGLGIGCLGILVWVMWVYYSWTVRYDPKTGYVGLHKVSVLLTNIVVFAAVGAAVGIVWGRVASRIARGEAKEKEIAEGESTHG